jgi:hypothetical protein
LKRNNGRRHLDSQAANPKVGSRKKVQALNHKSNPKHKKPSLKVATFHQTKVATKKISNKQKNHKNQKTAKASYRKTDCGKLLKCKNSFIREVSLLYVKGTLDYVIDY